MEKYVLLIPRADDCHANALKAYICNADNLGGFKLGSGGTDNILQTINSPGAVFGGAGSYPLEGGYMYFTPVGSPTLGKCKESLSSCVAAD